ncbi:MAG: ABC transporter permease [Bacteroidota bacterium]
MALPALRFALRRLLRRPGASALHVGGLSTGMVCCFLALLFIQDELSFDRFHEHAEQIFAVSEVRTLGDQRIALQATSAEAIDALRSGVPGVEAVTILDEDRGIVRRPGEVDGVALEAFAFADPAMFDVFTFPLVRGNEATALAGPNRAILTRSTAATLFGRDDVVGETVTLERNGFGLLEPEPLLLDVTGIVDDPPATSSIQFGMLVSGETPLASFDGEAPAHEAGGSTFVRTATAADTTAMKSVLDGFAADPERFSGFGMFAGIGLTPLVETHFTYNQPGLTGKRPLLYLFGIVAALVLLLACINYANLATAHALQRAREVGVRKALGAGRGQLATQHLAEAVLTSAAAGVVGAGVTLLLLPFFNDFFGKAIGREALTVPLLLLGTGVVVGAGLLAGAYPASRLVRFQPVEALRGRLARGRGGRRVQRTLVVVQFSVTAALLAGTALVIEQVRHVRAADLGFESDHVVTFDLQAPSLASRRDVLKVALEALPRVEAASVASAFPGRFDMSSIVSPGATPDDPSDDINALTATTDADYAAVLGLRLAAGRWYTPEASGEVVLNETAARQLGLMTTDPEAAVGQRLGNERQVVGVVEDFRIDGPRAAVVPIQLYPSDPAFSNQQRLAVRLSGADVAGALGSVAEAWAEVVPDHPFDPQFVEDRFAASLQRDRQLGVLLGFFGGVAVLLAVLGVFGLAAHAAERRTKEIGIRRVLGATISGLVVRLSSEFAVLVGVGLAVAAPVVVVVGQRWLEGFAFPAPLSPVPFVLVGLGVLALALLTSGVHAVRAATADPVRALRSD